MELFDNIDVLQSVDAPSMGLFGHVHLTLHLTLKTYVTLTTLMSYKSIDDPSMVLFGHVHLVQILPD